MLGEANADRATIKRSLGGNFTLPSTELLFSYDLKKHDNDNDKKPSFYANNCDNIDDHHHNHHRHHKDEH